MGTQTGRATYVKSTILPLPSRFVRPRSFHFCRMRNILGNMGFHVPFARLNAGIHTRSFAKSKCDP